MGNDMEITLQPELEQFIKAKVASGQYQSVEEAINAELKLLMEREQIYKGRFEELKQEISIDVEASERGEVIDGEIVFNQLQKKLEQHRTHFSNE